MNRNFVPDFCKVTLFITLLLLPKVKRLIFNILVPFRRQTMSEQKLPVSTTQRILINFLTLENVKPSEIL